MSARNFQVFGTKERFGNVTVHRGDAYLSVQVHRTIVVQLDLLSKAVKLNTGGWQTLTTKTAINTALDQIAPGFRVYGNKGTWYLYYRGRRVDVYRDYMVFCPDDAEYKEVAEQGGIL